MAAWKNLTPGERRKLKTSLLEALSERGIDATRVEFDPSGLPGRYRLIVVAPEFGQLDYSERLAVLWSAIGESWPRVDQLRLTLVFPLDPSEVPINGRGGPDAARRTRRKRNSA